MFYENFLNSIKPDMSFIPESASFNDMVVFTNRAIQDAYNEAAISITCQEIAIFESALNEASEDPTSVLKNDPAAAANAPVSQEQKKTILGTIKKFFSWIWDKIKGFFSTIISKIKEIFAKVVVGKGKGTRENFISAIDKFEKDEKLKDTEFKVYPFNFTKEIAKVIMAANGEIISTTKSFINKDITADNVADEVENFKKAADDDNKALKEAEKAYKKEIKDSTIKCTISHIKSNKNTILDVVYGGSGWLKYVEKSYSECKKVIDDNMKSFKEAVNRAKDKGQISALKGKLQMVKIESNLLTKVMGLYNGLMRKLRSNYVSVVAKVLVATQTKLTKEDVEITINTAGEEEEDKIEAAPEVKDEVEEAFASFIKEEDEVEDVIDSDEDGVEDVEVDAKIEESTLYKALVAYLG